MDASIQLYRLINEAGFNINNFKILIMEKYDPSKIFIFGQTNHLSQIGFRVFAWRIYLNIIQGTNISEWVKEMQLTRIKFNQISQDNSNIANINPLNLIKVSPLLERREGNTENWR